MLHTRVRVDQTLVSSNLFVPGRVEDGLVHISYHVSSVEHRVLNEIVRVIWQRIMFTSRSFAAKRYRAGERWHRECF